MRDLFQVVYDLKKKDVDKTKQYSFDAGGKMVNTYFYYSDPIKMMKPSSSNRAAKNPLLILSFNTEKHLTKHFLESAVIY